MRALKFLLPGAVGPFSGLSWPVPIGDAPGPWVDAGGQARCERGVHACLVDDLPFWLQLELWEIELRPDSLRSGRKLVAAGGRLVRRVDEWNSATSSAFAQSCLGRVRAVAGREPALAGYVSDGEHHLHHEHPAPVAYIAARAAELADGPAGYDAERAAQAAWLADRLGLERFAA